jgi:hypothetical protein
MCTHGNSLSA